MTTAVMVVSPQASFRFALEQMLIEGGYIVCQGLAKLEAFRHALNACETPPKIILLDFWMGHAETTGFIKSLKQEGFTIVLMGTKFRGREIAAHEGIRFLEKPFTRLDLLRAL
ncbi:MAG: hypothetical protein ACFE89_10090 [Candidatus Hodarchaeota archaeon]